MRAVGRDSKKRGHCSAKLGSSSKRRADSGGDDPVEGSIETLRKRRRAAPLKLRENLCGDPPVKVPGLVVDFLQNG